MHKFTTKTVNDDQIFYIQLDISSLSQLNKPTFIYYYLFTVISLSHTQLEDSIVNSFKTPL